MFNYNSSKRAGFKRYLVLDIRSASIGIGVIEKTKGEIPKIIYTQRNRITLEQGQDLKTFIKRFMSEIDLMLNNFEEKVLKDIGVKIDSFDKAFVMYSAPWYTSKTHVMTLSNTQPFIFTKDFLQKFISENPSIKGNATEDRKIIEVDVVDIFINGYKIASPFGKRVEELKLSLFTGLIAKDTHKVIVDKIYDRFGIRDIEHRTLPYVLFSVIRNTFADKDDFLMFDMGGEATDFGYVKADSLLKTKCIPFGKGHLIREVGNKCKLDKHTALSLMKISADGDIDNRCDKATPQILSEAENKWYQLVKESLSENIPSGNIPNDIFVISDDDTSSYIKHVLINKSLENKDGIISKDKNILEFNNNSLNDYVSYANSVNKDIYFSSVATLLSLDDTIDSIVYIK